MSNRFSIHDFFSLQPARHNAPGWVLLFALLTALILTTWWNPATAETIATEPVSPTISALETDLDLLSTVSLSSQTEPYWYERRTLVIAALTFMFLEGVLIIWLIRLLLRQRHLRREARQGSERFKNLFDLAPFACTVNDLEGRYLMVNQAFSQSTGVPAAEALGRTSLELGIIFDRDSVRTINEELERHGIASGLEATLTIREHKILHTLHACKFIDWNGGKALLTATADITRILETEQALRQSEERYRDLVEGANIIIIKFDTSGVVTFANEYALHFFGYSEAELIGKNVVGTIVPEMESSGRDLVRMIAAICQDDETLRDNINENKTRDGRRIWIHWNNRVTRDKEGHILEISSFGSDITKRKQAEEEQEKLRRQLLQAQKMESVGRLAGGVAHDFNNMLGVIIGYTELALENIAPTDPLRRKLLQILNAAERSAELTRQLLAFARKQPIAPRTLDLNKAVEKTLNMLRRLIGEDIELTWQPAPGLWPVLMDPAQVDQILTNLCINAKDAITGKGRITITTANRVVDAISCAACPGLTPGAYVLITVSDNGCGMNLEIQEQIFDPFFTTKDHGQGTGLGLAMVNGIITQNKGCIHCTSTPGQGTEFTIYLPRHRDDDQQCKNEPADIAPLTGKETILLVEDEPTLLDLSTVMLQSLGYTVLSASGPDVALGLTRDHDNIDLLITDVIMPGMNGKELARQALNLQPTMRCLFMSGYTADVIGKQGVLEPGVQFIQKPFSITTLAAKVREVLGHQQPPG
ncbi:hybrid sensor histidine kinase/response regulator [Desulfobulbus alkaliphilus]|uniref:hybrid sensor histidine kinase/response regulator n=1 Tax=Desulfobulbus alkaliphilus TaxID=869814 RepID=UPI00196580B2|nr:PAS domain-containing sensor histidine kinase [Desulfobulbus alkaliphilus]MBM9535585.1 PAS domain S-box protein [Desulfobulbus alkaliphilus]